MPRTRRTIDHAATIRLNVRNMPDAVLRYSIRTREANGWTETLVEGVNMYDVMKAEAARRGVEC